MASPEMQKGACQGAQIRNPIIISPDNTPLELQAQRLSRRFGFAFETCIVIASLAWGIGR